MTWLGPKPGEVLEPLPGEIPAQDEPVDPDPGYAHIDLRLPKPTYIALGKIAQLLRADSGDEIVAELALRAVEAYVPYLVGQVEAIKSAKGLPSVYIADASSPA